MSWIYTDYLEIKQEFVPVFTEEQDRNHPQSWKTFIAHKAFSNLLLNMIKALERGSSQDKCSLWIKGAYGTGKTFAVFVLKHIMEEPFEVVEEFFRSNPVIEPYWQRLKSLRENSNYLIIYRSSSSHITSPFKFLAEIQHTVLISDILNTYVIASEAKQSRVR